MIAEQDSMGRGIRSNWMIGLASLIGLAVYPLPVCAAGDHANGVRQRADRRGAAGAVGLIVLCWPRSCVKSIRCGRGRRGPDCRPVGVDGRDRRGRAADPLVPGRIADLPAGHPGRVCLRTGLRIPARRADPGRLRLSDRRNRPVGSVPDARRGLGRHGAGLLPKPERRGQQLAILAIFGVASGLLFGALLNLWFWPFAAPAAARSRPGCPGRPIYA